MTQSTSCRKSQLNHEYMRNGEQGTGLYDPSLLTQLDRESYRGIEGIRPPNRLAAAILELATNYHVDPLHIDGLEKLESGLKKARELGGAVVIASAHLSQVDGPIVRKVLRKSGLLTDDIETVPLLGLRLYRRPLTRMLARGVPHIPVWPPTERPTTREELDYAKELTLRAKETQRRASSQGVPTLIFPQGGRGNGEIDRQPVAGTADFLTNPNNVLMPLAFVADHILPKGQWRPVKGAVDAVFGEPLPVPELIDELGLSIDQPLTPKQKFIFADTVMRRVAEMLPLEKQGVYRKK